MKRYLILAGLAFCSLVKTNAQVRFGLEAGVNLTNMVNTVNGEKQEGGFLPGAKAGGLMDIRLGHVSLQPGLYYSGKGFADKTTSTITTGGVTYNETDRVMMRVHYLEIPFNVNYNFSSTGPGHFFAGAGPYLGVAIGGKLATNSERTLVNGNGEGFDRETTASRSLNIGDEAGDDINRTDLGMNINVGYEFASSLFLRAGIGFGLANLRPNGNEDYALRNFSSGLTIGYFFH